MDEVADIRLIHPHTCIIDMPTLDVGGEGKTRFAVPYAELLPRIFTKVLATHPTCQYVKPGDQVMFLPNHVMSYMRSDMTLVWAMDERACQVIIEGIDL